MLNRLYIVVGILAILVLGAGFIVPRLMNWNDYRSRLEALAEANLGTDVIIGGQIEFTLLPQPRIRFGKTFVGSAFSPMLEIGSIEAEFSLMDFLRDRFVITKLVLQSPKINLVVSKSGQFEFPFEFPAIFSAGNISVAEAQIVDGSVELFDERLNRYWVYEKFNGELSASGLRGPFGLKGTGEYLDNPYSIRVNLSALNARNQSQSSVFLRPVSGQYSLAGEGVMTFGEVPLFAGKAVLRSSPIYAAPEDIARGDLVVSSEVEVSTEKLLFSAFEIQPDENLAGSRLSGAAIVNLGSNASFNAVVSGGVVGFAQKDITEENPATSSAFLGFLAQLPAPYMPKIPGRIGLDIAELNVHDIALRDVRLDATSDGLRWNVEKFQADFTGNSRVNFSGEVAERDGNLRIGGALGVQSGRLATLARLWREVDATSALHNRAGRIAADVNLSDAVFSLENGTLEIDNITHGFDGQLLLSDERTLNATVRLAPMNEKQSERLVSLLPELSLDSSFAKMFPQGKFELRAEQGFLLGMQGNSLALNASWNSSGINIERLSASDLGGAQFFVTGDLIDKNGAAQLTLGGRLTLGVEAENGVLARLSERFGWDVRVGQAVAQSLPVDVQFDLGPVDDNQNQLLSAQGRAGAANLLFSLAFENMLAAERTDFIDFSTSLIAPDIEALAQQTGLGGRAYFEPGKEVELQLLANGFLSGQLQTNIMAHTGGEHVGYEGTADFSNPELVSGQGKMSFQVADFSAFAEFSGVKPFFLPGGRGSADFEFDTSGSYKIENLSFAGKGQDEPVTGNLRLTKSDEEVALGGQLNIGVLDISDLVSTVLGPAALIGGEGYWPEGPLDIGRRSEKSRGRIEVNSPKVGVNDRGGVSAASFELVWDASSVSLENIIGGSGAGQLRGDMRICCSAPDATKQVRARLALTQVSLSDFVSSGIGENLSGVLSGGVIFNATGATIDELVNSATGEGSFSLDYAVMRHMDPAAFLSLVSLEDIGEYDAQSLSALVGIALDQGDFETQSISGVFQLTRGKVRADNIVATNDDARLLADIRVDLADLSLGGGWTFFPTRLEDPTGHVDENSARIAANLTGDLVAPARVLDLEQMVEAIKLRALEIELDQLEKIRAEQLARSAEMAANRARLMELEAQRKREEAERLAAEEEHLRQKQEAEREAAQALLEAGQEPLVFNLDSQDPLFWQEQLLLSDPLSNESSIIDLPALPSE